MMTITAAAAVRRAIPARGATRRARGFDVCRGSAGESNNEQKWHILNPQITKSIMAST